MFPILTDSIELTHQIEKYCVRNKFDSSRSEPAEGRRSVASVYGMQSSTVYTEAGFLVLASVCSSLARLTITSREMRITFCFKSTFCRQIVSCFEYFLIK